MAREEGTLRILDECVGLETGGEWTLLFWPEDRTRWIAGSKAITFHNFDGTSVTVADGDVVVLGGGGDSSEESGISGADWIEGMSWIARPAPSCPSEHRFGVGAVEP